MIFNDKEVWKDVNGYEGYYQISNHGNVKSVDRVLYYNKKTVNVKGKLLRFNVNKNIKNLKIVHLYKVGEKRKAISVHKLVALHFVENPDNKAEVNHIDGNRFNNHWTNLEWVTRQENMAHGFKTGLINNTGVNHGNNVYSEKQIQKVVNMIAEGYIQSEIEKVTKVKIGTIQQIKRGKQWCHIKPKL